MAPTNFLTAQVHGFTPANVLCAIAQNTKELEERSVFIPLAECFAVCARCLQITPPGRGLRAKVIWLRAGASLKLSWQAEAIEHGEATVACGAQQQVTRSRSIRSAEICRHSQRPGTIPTQHNARFADATVTSSDHNDSCAITCPNYETVTGTCTTSRSTCTVCLG